MKIVATIITAEINDDVGRVTKPVRSTCNSQDGSLCTSDDDMFHILLSLLIITFIHGMVFIMMS